MKLFFHELTLDDGKNLIQSYSILQNKKMKISFHRSRSQIHELSVFCLSLMFRCLVVRRKEIWHFVTAI